jgi:hypothetical protein
MRNILFEYLLYVLPVRCTEKGCVMGITSGSIRGNTGAIMQSAADVMAHLTRSACDQLSTETAVGTGMRFSKRKMDIEAGFSTLDTNSHQKYFDSISLNPVSL